MNTSVRHASTVVLAALLAAAGACVDRSDSDPDPDDVGASSSAILGGAGDTDTRGVVGIANLDGPDVCSGVLLAPGLVLAAQRCVAPIVNPGPCAGATFGAARAPDHFFITTKTPMTQSPGDYHEVTEIRTPPGGPAYCGRDLVLLRLFSNVTPTEMAVAIEPRFDAVAAAQGYAAIGYGGTADTGAGGGQRRRLTNLSIACVGAACSSPAIGAGEWRGSAGVCPGDQGGPAVDGSNKALGIASRSAAACADSIYTAIAPHRDWIIQETIRAAGLNAFSPPAWTGAAPAIDAGVDAAVGPDAGTEPPDEDDDGGCSTAGGSARGGGLGALVLALAVLASVGRRCAFVRN